MGEDKSCDGKIGNLTQEKLSVAERIKKERKEENDRGEGKKKRRD
jgi:hypothetical protein